MRNHINLGQIETDDDLARVLKSLGFESHAVVIADNRVLYLYYYDESDDLFKEWIRLSGEVHLNIIRDDLNAAMTLAGIKKRLATRQS